jgi:CRP-like cAMP-binding protein
MTSVSTTSNLLLASLDEDDLAVLEPQLTRVQLSTGDVLTDPFEAVEFIYFLEDGIASVVSHVNDNAEAQVSMIGHEGMSATSVILGVDQTPFLTRIHVGTPTAWRISTKSLLLAMQERLTLRNALHKYAHVVAVQVGESAVVNASFDIRRRVARFLLMCHDRVASDSLSVTHQLVARLLDVRRPGVSVVLKSFEAAGAIRSGRGIIVVTHRARLMEIAGNAYGTAEAEYRRLLGPFGKCETNNSEGLKRQKRHLRSR